MGRFIDLTLPYDEKTANYSWDVARTLELNGWNARTLHIYSHAGTHMDAPFHFGVNDKTIDEIDPARFITDCWVINLPNCEPKKLIQINDLGYVQKEIRAGESLLFASGWSRLLGTPDYRDALPRISDELADWMVENKVNMVLVEPPSVADVNNKDEVTGIHRKLLGGDIIIVEGICNTDQLKSDKIKIMAFPLKVKKGDGAPARVIAVEE